MKGFGSASYAKGKVKTRPAEQGRQWHIPYAGTRADLFSYHFFYTSADLTVLMITAATLYGSAAELGRRSSK